MTCRIGILLKDKAALEFSSGVRGSMEEMTAVWKALGDKSKFEILLYIKQKSAYGSEIAKHFSLTTATVSHHMNKLQQLGLVRAELKEGRLYYKTRNDRLREFFEDAKELFGEGAL